jgi:hypothetical protein
VFSGAECTCILRKESLFSSDDADNATCVSIGGNRFTLPGIKTSVGAFKAALDADCELLNAGDTLFQDHLFIIVRITSFY